MTLCGRKLFVLSSFGGLEAYGAAASDDASAHQQFVGRWASPAAAHGVPTIAAEGSRKLHKLHVWVKHGILHYS